MAIKIIKITSFIIIFILVCMAGHSFGCYLVNQKHMQEYPFVAGRTGKKCYTSDNYHGNIRYHVYFKTLEECEKYIINNQ